MTKKTKIEEEIDRLQAEENMDFYFWLGADGVLTNTTLTEFKQKQEEWEGMRPGEQYIGG